MEIIKKVCNKKIDEINRKVFEIQSNQSDSNSKTASIHLKFISF